MNFLLSFDWVEGNRTFDIVFGAATSLTCLLLAVPLIVWMLPSHRRYFFGRAADPHQYLQLAYGVAAMSMAFADALCRFIPHRPLAFTHPAFFLTTLALVLLLGWSRVRSVATPLAWALPVLVAFPVSAVVNAFW